MSLDRKPSNDDLTMSANRTYASIHQDKNEKKQTIEPKRLIDPKDKLTEEELAEERELEKMHDRLRIEKQKVKFNFEQLDKLASLKRKLGAEK